MNKDSLWSTFRKYIWQYRKTLTLFLCCMVIFIAIFFLYGLPTEAVLYAAALCLILAAIWGTINFSRYFRRHQRLQELTSQPMLMAQLLPPPRNLREQDYHQLIQELYREASRLLSRSEASRRQAAEYYTLWAHQIKTPIAAMKLILDEQDSDVSRELNSELVKVEQYVELALCYLRINNNDSDFVFRPCSLEPLLRQAVRNWAPLFIRKKISLVFQVQEQTVLTDEKWLLLIVEQLLSNALKYTRSGSVTISTEGATLLIRDTGIGIAPEDIPRVFEQGFTGYNGRGGQKSSGIGLYLCHKLAEQMGHVISIDSVLGQGTTVRLDLSRDAVEYE